MSLSTEAIVVRDQLVEMGLETLHSKGFTVVTEDRSGEPLAKPQVMVQVEARREVERLLAVDGVGLV